MMRLAAAAVALLSALPVWGQDARVEWLSFNGRPDGASFVELRKTESAETIIVFHNRTVHQGNVDFTLKLDDLIVDVVLEWNVNGTNAERITIMPRGPFVSIPPELTVFEDQIGEAVIYPAMF